MSLLEQTLRYYNNGKLVRAFYVVTGQYLKPSPPGLWSIILRQSPTKFKSSEPQSSVFWYPPTPIQYAMEYHSGGYFFHDAWWRANFGPSDNFPHYDSSGTTSFNGNGVWLHQYEDQRHCMAVSPDLLGSSGDIVLSRFFV